MRIAPIDPTTHVSKVGIKNEVKKADPNMPNMPSFSVKVTLRKFKFKKGQNRILRWIQDPRGHR